MFSYCLKCRKNTESKNPKVVRTEIGRIMLLSKCEVWDTKKVNFIKEQEANGLLSRLGINSPLSLIRMGFFGAAHRWWERVAPSLISVTPTMMKLGTVLPYPKKIKKNLSHVTHPLSSADISSFSPEISKFCYIKKYRYRLHFDT